MPVHFMVTTGYKRKQSALEAVVCPDPGCVTVDKVLSLFEIPDSLVIKSGRCLYPNQQNTISGFLPHRKHFSKRDTINTFL